MTVHFIGRQIKYYRQLRHLTQLQFAQAVGVSQPTVVAWESLDAAKVKNPMVHKLPAIARVLGITETHLFAECLPAVPCDTTEVPA